MAFGLIGSVAFGASVQLNYVGAAFDVFSYSNTSATPEAYTLRGSYDAGHRVSAAIVIGDALPSNARIQMLSPGAYDLTTGAALPYTLNLQSVSVSDGINSFQHLDDIILETNANGDIVYWDLVSYYGGPDFEGLVANSANGDNARYTYTYQYTCPPSSNCQYGNWGLGGEVSSGRNSAAGSWSISTPLSGGNVLVTAAPVPLPAGGLLLLGGLGCLAFGRRMVRGGV